MLKVEKNIPLYAYVNYRKIQKVCKLSFFFFLVENYVKKFRYIEKFYQKKSDTLGNRHVDLITRTVVCFSSVCPFP